MMNHSTKTFPSDENFPSIPVHVAGNRNVLWSIFRLEQSVGESRRSQRLRSSNAAQSMLHNLALSHLGPSEAFEISKEPSGRPVIKLRDKSLMASISHSRNVVCVALACDEKIVVGIDVEFHDPSRNVGNILQSLGWPDVGTSAEEFYQEWCLYEARFKATGIVTRNEQPEMSGFKLAVQDQDQYTGMLAWAAECGDTSNT